jgi:hypothetical protein
MKGANQEIGVPGKDYPLQSLQNLWPQRWQTCVNLRVRSPHLQHFMLIFFPPCPHACPAKGWVNPCGTSLI